MFGGGRQTLYLLGTSYLLTLILAGGVLRAQDASTGALRGTVLDAQGAAIAAADIVAKAARKGFLPNMSRGLLLDEDS